MTIYHESVSTGIPVLFIHAGIADSRMWDPQFESVPDGFRYVRVDLQGFGRSPFAGVEYANHDDVLAVMEHLSVESAILVGCSRGGETALQLVETAADRVLGLVLIGASAPGFDPPDDDFEPPQWSEAVAAHKRGDMERLAELEAEMWVVGRGRPVEDVDTNLIESVIEMNRIPAGSEARREEVRTEPDMPLLPRLDVPTLVVIGEHDYLDLRAASDHLAEQLSDRDAVVIAQTAHLPSLEQPEIFNQVLGDFLSWFG